jgi:myo-inositol-1(or 4)-monophosphatase
MPNLSELLEVATEAAWAARPPHARRTSTLRSRSSSRPTRARSRRRTARPSRSAARSSAGHFPTHGILGEEFGETAGNGSDPLDSSIRSTARRRSCAGSRLYGTLVGVEVDGDPKVGVIYLPALDEMVTGAEGMPALWNGRPVHVSPTARALRSAR